MRLTYYLLLSILIPYSPAICAGGADVYASTDGQIITLYQRTAKKPVPHTKDSKPVKLLRTASKQPRQKTNTPAK